MKSEEVIRKEQQRIKELYHQRKDEAMRKVEQHKRDVVQRARLLSTKTDQDLLIENILREVGGLEKLVEKIGIEKIETVLRAHKIKKIKNKL